MSSRWENPVFEQILAHFDPNAVRGRAVRSTGLDCRLFDGWPESHPGDVAVAMRTVYELLRGAACAAGRLASEEPLVKRWKLTGDIYSPKLERFIEVDEYQHFSAVRLARILENRAVPWRPLYACHFWDNVLPHLLAKPYHDLDPPHRDEARAYRDEMRERLPVFYGLRRTVRLDEFTLKEIGPGHVVGLLLQMLESEGSDGHPERTTEFFG